eukprot:7535294-Alexandrium_andersonii.AAC.1
MLTSAGAPLPGPGGSTAPPQPGDHAEEADLPLAAAGLGEGGHQHCELLNGQSSSGFNFIQ